MITPTPTGLSKGERAVWNALRYYAMGRKNAVRKHRLSRITGLNERTMRKIIKDLIEVHQLPIGSTSSFPAGYFICQTSEEVEDICETSWRQAISLLKRVGSLRRQNARQVSQQIELALAEAQS